MKALILREGPKPQVALEPENEADREILEQMYGWGAAIVVKWATAEDAPLGRVTFVPVPQLTFRKEATRA